MIYTYEEEQLIRELCRWVDSIISVNSIDFCKLYIDFLYDAKKDFYFTECKFHIDNNAMNKDALKVWKIGKRSITKQEFGRSHYYAYIFECNICGRFSATQYIKKIKNIDDDFEACSLLIHDMNLIIPEVYLGDNLNIFYKNMKFKKGE